MRLEREPEVIRAILERDRPYAAIPLACLEPEWFPYCRFYLNVAETSCVWLFDHPAMGKIVQTFGDAGDLTILLERVDLPGRAHLTLRREHLGTVARFYGLTGANPEWIMHVSPEIYRKPASELAARQLGPSDAAAAGSLLALWDQASFDPSRFERGFLYFGVFFRQGEGEKLVAIAGNQVRSATAGVAKVISVFVHPDYRGKGLGKMVTAAITEALFAYGARDVILHVLEDNVLAIATYERLGYRRDCRIFDLLSAKRL